MKPNLTVVIPTYDNAEQLTLCLGTMFRYVEYPYKVILIDNGGIGLADNGVPPGMEGMIEVVDVGKNLGWTGAHAEVLPKIDTEFYCMLNDDVAFIPSQTGFFRNLITHFKDEEVGAVGPASNFVMGGQSILNLSVPITFDASLLIGFCLVSKTEILREVGGFDPSLPGGDDLDLSIRLQNAGYVLRVHKNCYLHHFGQQTGKRVKGDDWDSLWSQEVTNNALIHKHGIAKWNACMTQHWKYPSYFQAESEAINEELWYSRQMDKLEGLQGLNVGCGDKNIGNSIGVDNRGPGELGAGSQRFTESVAGIQAEADNIPLDDSSQDYIIASHILEHMIDPIATLEEWSRLLKANGTLLLTLPDHSKFNTMLVDSTHVHAYTEESLRGLLSLCGFKNLWTETTVLGAIRCICNTADVSAEEMELV